MVKCESVVRQIYRVILEAGKQGDVALDCHRSVPMISRLKNYVEFMDENKLPIGKFTEGATRHIRGLPCADQKRVAQCLRDKLQGKWKDEGRITTAMINKEIHRLNGVHIHKPTRKRVESKVAQRQSSSLSTEDSGMSFPTMSSGDSFLHEVKVAEHKPDSTLSSMELAGLPPLIKDSEGKSGSLVTVAYQPQYPGLNNCLCAGCPNEDGCPALGRWRLREREQGL